MSATDHTLTAAEREDIEELLRLHVLADDEQVVYDLFESILAARLAAAEAEKEALRAESSIARMDAERYAGDVEALDALTTLITDVYTSHPLDIARVILVSDFMAQVKRDAYDAGFHDGRAER